MDLQLDAIGTGAAPEAYFDSTVTGYEKHDWWSREWLASTGEYVVFRLGSEEVARATVYHDRLIAGPFKDLDPSPKVFKLHFFEVKQCYRGKGIARAALELLSDHYQGSLLTAFSIHAAEKFWMNSGWKYYPREKGDTPGDQKLFVSDRRHG